ncbi:MAG: TusE/DsrC/DsvC family sulfur relay protein [Sulfuricella sp.]|nr:TusE/DsrC/DsvC family sulfur relay protein [Sulfuricella sp.]
MKFDADGFLDDPTAWSRELAQQLATEDGIGPLGDAHWAVIDELRAHYLDYGALPPGSHVCRVNRLDTQCVPGLFANMREAWRIAGLPNPGEEAKSYM